MLIFTDGPEPGRDKRQRSGVVHNVDWLIDIDRKVRLRLTFPYSRQRFGAP